MVLHYTGCVGGNGVGKTTFLNVLTQQQQLDSGVVTVGETVRYGT
jgi:ABC transport system ATP-binding/permease protein